MFKALVKLVVRPERRERGINSLTLLASEWREDKSGCFMVR